MDKIILNADAAKKLTTDQFVQKLSTTPSKGLTSTEVTERLQTFGSNSIPEKKTSPVLKFLKNFVRPIPILIMIAAVLSAVIKHWLDFTIIVFLLFANAIIEFIQSYKADRAIETLKKSLANHSKVLRDGTWEEINAQELVPGDVIRIRMGDIIPADVKLIDGDYLQVDQSALTGESLPVSKKAGDIAYSGSIAKKGEMTGIVYSTGLNTYFGETVKLISKAKTVSHFQKAVVKIGNFLILLDFLFVLLIVFHGLFRGESIPMVIQYALVLTIASIPIAMPTVLSVTMAVGALMLSKKKAIVSKLEAVEELAGMNILCSDKTGTLTQNKLAICSLHPVGNFKNDDILYFAALASKAEDNDPIDNAILAKLSDQQKAHINTCQVTKFIPFDPISKRSEGDIHDQNTTFKASKGAPQMILNLAANKAQINKEIMDIVNAAAKKGERALGVARTNATGAWEFVGLIFMSDPPRPDSASTIQTAQKMGVEVKMITGDQEAIAYNMATQLHIGKNILPASKLHQISDRKALALANSANGFSEVLPEDKYDIVEILQEENNIVGMTGDGVNDAPALKKADVGIAVSGATDAAKSAAAIVLTLPGLNVIITAIQESRKIFQRMQSYTIYRISETIDVLFFTVLAILIFHHYPVTAVAIILLSLFNDFPIMAIAYDKVTFCKKPETWAMKKVIGVGSFLGFTNVAFTFLVFYLGLYVLKMPFPKVQTLVFAELSIAGNFTVFLSRVRGRFWTVLPGKGLFWSSFLSKAFISCVVGFGWFMAPIGWWVFAIWGYATLQMLITDTAKEFAYRVFE